MRFSRKSNKPFNAGASTLYFLYCYIFTGMLFCVFWGASFLFADALTTLKKGIEHSKRPLWRLYADGAWGDDAGTAPEWAAPRLADPKAGTTASA